MPKTAKKKITTKKTTTEKTKPITKKRLTEKKYPILSPRYRINHAHPEWEKHLLSACMNMLCGKLISFNGGVIEWSSKYMEKRKEKMVLGYQIPTKINDHIIGISEEAMSEQMRLAPIFPMVYTDDGYFHPTKADEIYMSLKLKGYDIYMTSTLLNNFNEWVYRYLKIEKTKKKADIISPIPGGFTFDDTTYSVMKYINGTEIHFSGIGKKSFEHTCQILLFDHVDITISVEWDFDMSDKTS